MAKVSHPCDIIIVAANFILGWFYHEYIDGKG
jgi:hypothetical protein